ncbi:MAG: phosphatase PAP2 family protein [Bacteroidota bacterium]
MKNFIITIIVGLVHFSVLAQQPLTANEQWHKNTGDALVVSLPVLALGSTFIWKDGQEGTYQFSKALTSTLALSYGLKFLVEKERPNGENNLSFPSAHTSVAFASAAFVQKRYGWEYGIPAYALATYVGYTRIQANKHDGWDVLAGAAIGTGMSYLFTKTYKKDRKFRLRSGFMENTPTFGFTYKF